MRHLIRYRAGRRAALITAIVVLSFVAGGVAVGAAVPAIQTFTPRSEQQITNIDVLRQQIRNYYGDPLGTGVVRAGQQLRQGGAAVASRGARRGSSWPHQHGHGTKAIVLDVDDTTLATWNYEIFSNWAFNPTTNATFVTEQRFPAVPGMVDDGDQARPAGLRDLLPDRPARRAGGGDARQPDRRRHRRGRRLPGADHARQRRGRPVHQAGGRRLPGLPEGRLRRRPERRRARRSTTSRRPARTSSRSATTSWPTSATSSATSKGGFADRTFKLPNPNYFLP